MPSSAPSVKTKPMKSYKLLALGLTTLLALFAQGSFAYGDSDSGAKNWKLSTSVTGRLSYDTNIFQSGVGLLANKDAFVYTLAPTFKLTGKLYEAALTLSYTPTMNLYSDYSSQCDNLSQLFSAEAKRSLWGFDWTGKSSILWVVGSADMPFYDLGAGTGYSPGMAAPASVARADQLQWRYNLSGVKKWDKYLFEPMLNVVWSDFRTPQTATPAGHYNLADRGDLSAGFNAGYNFWKEVYALAGYRIGRQLQGLHQGSADAYTSTYQRVLVGLRGKVWDNLKFDFLVGPDFRKFTENTASSFDRTNVFWYYEGSATYTPTDKDTLSLKLSRSIGLSGSSPAAYEDCVVQAKYERKLTDKVSVDASMYFDHRPYLTGNSSRNEDFYSPSLGVTYKPKKDLSCRAAWVYEEDQSNTKTATGYQQEFIRNIFSVECTYNF